MVIILNSEANKNISKSKKKKMKVAHILIRKYKMQDLEKSDIVLCDIGFATCTKCMFMQLVRKLRGSFQLLIEIISHLFEDSNYLRCF